MTVILQPSLFPWSMKIKGAFELLGRKKLTGRSRMIDRFIGREWRFVRRKL